MLLNADGKEGWYFHVTELSNFPRFMGCQGYQRYLKENDKREITRIPLRLSRPEEARKELYRLLYLEWFWLPTGVWNCSGFVNRIVSAGGAELYSVCPRGYTVATDFTPLQQ
jgi:hypothetical protein